MNEKGHVKVLLDWAVAGLCLLALADLATGRFGEFVEDCGFAVLLLVLNFDWPRHGLQANVHWPRTRAVAGMVWGGKTEKLKS